MFAHCIVVDRHKGERVERNKKTDCADQTRRDSLRIQEFKDRPVTLITARRVYLQNDEPVDEAAIASA